MQIPYSKPFGILYFLVLLAKPAIASDFQALQKYVQDLAPGEWIELPATRIPLISKTEVDSIHATQGGAGIWGVMGSKSVINQRNGAAFDGKRWWFFGGGGRAYGGNEFYQFDFTTLHWNRLTSPAPLTGPNRASTKSKTQCPSPADGSASTQTYDGITWNPVSKTVWVLIAGGFCNAGGKYSKAQSKFWEFDPVTKEWTAHQVNDVHTGFTMSAWNPLSKRIVVVPRHHHKDSVGPFEIDENGRILRRGKVRAGIGVGTLAYDSVNKSMYAATKNNMLRLDLEDDPLKGVIKDSKIPQTMIDAGVKSGGLAFNPTINSFVFWSGKRTVWTWNLDTRKFKSYSNADSKQAPAGSDKVFSKWIYLPELNVFAGMSKHDQGVWIYKLGGESKTLDPDELRACLNSQCTFSSIGAAFRKARDGDEIKILPGEWAEGGILKANHVTVKAFNAILTKAVGGKGALVIRGDNTTIEGLECKHVNVPSGNGACVRQEGKNLTLKNVYFHHNQEGILSGKNSTSIVIEDSRFEYNGHLSRPVGRSHGIYVNGDQLLIRRCKIINTGNEGHEIKSRARVTVIEDSIIASRGARDSRLIDLPNGGKLTIKNSVLQHGKNSANQELVGYGWERGKRGEEWTENSLVLEGNTIILDGAKDKLLGMKPGLVEPVVRGNVIVGGKKNYQGNCHFETRKQAGLSVYPDIDVSLQCDARY